MEILKVPALREWLLQRSQNTIFPILASCYGFSAAELHYMDLFLVRYDGDTGGAQRGLMPHRDRSLLSFNLLLSDPSSFDGGGTAFDALGGEEHAVRPEHIGDLTMHPGKARHAGVQITRGTRYVLVGFVGVRSPRVDAAFLQTLKAKLNVPGADRDFAILSSALIAPPPDDWHAPQLVPHPSQDSLALDEPQSNELQSNGPQSNELHSIERSFSPAVVMALGVAVALALEALRRMRAPGGR